MCFIWVLILSHLNGATHDCPSVGALRLAPTHSSCPNARQKRAHQPHQCGACEMQHSHLAWYQSPWCRRMRERHQWWWFSQSYLDWIHVASCTITRMIMSDSSETAWNEYNNSSVGIHTWYQQSHLDEATRKLCWMMGKQLRFFLLLLSLFFRVVCAEGKLATRYRTTAQSICFYWCHVHVKHYASMFTV